MASNKEISKKYQLLDEIEEVYVFPAMGDEGLGLGAALYEPKFAHDIQSARTARETYERALQRREEVLASMKHTGAYGEMNFTDLLAKKLMVMGYF